MSTAPALQGTWRAASRVSFGEQDVHRANFLAAPLNTSDGSVTARFGERLRYLRKAQGMTQVELARHMGIDRSFISDVERGKKTISLDYLDTLAKGFKLTLTELMQGL